MSGRPTRALIAAALLALLVALPCPAGAETHGAAPNGGSGGFFTNINRDAALAGGAVLGLVLASGVVNLINAGTLMYGGAAVFEALESGAGIGVPVVLLGATLGAVFGQDLIYRNLPWLGGGEHTDHPAKPKH